MLPEHVHCILWEFEISELCLLDFSLLHVDYLGQEIVISHVLVVDYVSNLLLQSLVYLNSLFPHCILELLA